MTASRSNPSSSSSSAARWTRSTPTSTPRKTPAAPPQPRSTEPVSRATTLGDYTGGALWILDENGADVEVEVTAPLRWEGLAHAAATQDTSSEENEGNAGHPTSEGGDDGGWQEAIYKKQKHRVRSSTPGLPTSQALPIPDANSWIPTRT